MVLVLLLVCLICTSLEVRDGELPLGIDGILFALNAIIARNGRRRGHGEKGKGGEDVK